MPRFVEICVLMLGVLLVALLLTPCAEAFAADDCDEPCCAESGDGEICTDTAMAAGHGHRAVAANDGRVRVLSLARPQFGVGLLSSSESGARQHTAPMRI